MIFLPIPGQNFFSGLNVVTSADDIKESDSPDCRNDDISHAGTLKTRTGTTKINTTAKANPPIYDLAYIINEGEVKTTMYMDVSGNLITF